MIKVIPFYTLCSSVSRTNGLTEAPDAEQVMPRRRAVLSPPELKRNPIFQLWGASTKTRNLFSWQAPSKSSGTDGSPAFAVSPCPAPPTPRWGPRAPGATPRRGQFPHIGAEARGPHSSQAQGKVRGKSGRRSRRADASSLPLCLSAGPPATLRHRLDRRRRAPPATAQPRPRAASGYARWPRAGGSGGACAAGLSWAGPGPLPPRFRRRAGGAWGGGRCAAPCLGTRRRLRSRRGAAVAEARWEHGRVAAGGSAGRAGVGGRAVAAAGPHQGPLVRQHGERGGAAGRALRGAPAQPRGHAAGHRPQVQRHGKASAAGASRGRAAGPVAAMGSRNSGTLGPASNGAEAEAALEVKTATSNSCPVEHLLPTAGRRFRSHGGRGASFSFSVCSADIRPARRGQCPAGPALPETGHKAFGSTGLTLTGAGYLLGREVHLLPPGRPVLMQFTTTLASE